MKLNAKVTTLDRDKERGVLFNGDVESGGYFFKLPNTEGYTLDDELVVLVLTKNEAAVLSKSLMKAARDGEGEFHQQTLAELAAQLRPDESVEMK